MHFCVLHSILILIAAGCFIRAHLRNRFCRDFALLQRGCFKISNCWWRRWCL